MGAEAAAKNEETTNPFIMRRKLLMSYKSLREKQSARIDPGERIKELVDEGTFEEMFSEMSTSDPLSFPGYGEKLELARSNTGSKDAFICGRGTVGAVKVYLGELSRHFMMGSMGTVVGEKIVRLAEAAGRDNCPLIIFAASGGARMQEGMFSLMQMARTSAAIQRFKSAGGLFISVLTHPCMGGVSASFASLSDICMAEPGALIGFAGPRVIEQTIRQQLPDGFQSAEFQLDHGFVDKIVPRAEMPGVLREILKLHGKGAGVRTENSEAAHLISERRKLSINVSNNRKDLLSARGNSVFSLSKNCRLSTCEMKPADTLTGIPSDSVAFSITQHNTTGKENENSGVVSGKKTANREDISVQKPAAWDRVCAARDKDRPRNPELISRIFEGFMEFSGDRLGGDDKAIMGGIAYLNGLPVTVIAHRKGRTAAENVEYNFGMPGPEGYRKALRLMRQAEKFGRPVITFIDTPGAYPGKEAEENGISISIAENLAAMSELKVPVIAVVTGEGSSGGALAIGVADRVLMLENAVYSILSPEGFSSILWKDPSRVKEACEVMRLTAYDLYEDGFVDEVIPEPEEGLAAGIDRFCEDLKKRLAAEL